VNRTLTFISASARAFWKLPALVQESLIQKLSLYGLTGEGDLKRMSGSNLLRMRHGEYRVIFEEAGSELIIVAVGHRREIYR
jgi:mRNA interferase RelE/StbE